MNTSAVAAILPRGQPWAIQRYGILVSTALLLCACVGVDISWRETLKSGLIFAMGSYPLCRLLQGRTQYIAYSVWVTLFAIHAGVRAFRTNFFGTEPDTAIVIDAILRSPPSFQKFSGSDDAVIEKMRRDGRSLWVRVLRNSYDNAMLYQDSIIAQLLRSFKADVGAAGSGAFLYTPDHAEEVGHTRDFAGHSPSEPGVTVPLIIWRSQALDSTSKHLLEQRPFQTDVLDWTLLDLAHIKTRHDQPQLDLLSPYFVAQKRYIDGKLYTPSKLAHD